MRDVPTASINGPAQGSSCRGMDIGDRKIDQPRRLIIHANLAFSRPKVWVFCQASTKIGICTHVLVRYFYVSCTIQLFVPPILSTCLLHTNSGRRKREAHINWSMVTCEGSTRYSTYLLADNWSFCAGGLSAVNAIGTHFFVGPDKLGTDLMAFGGIKDSIAVATNSHSMMFVTIVSCVRWCVCVCVCSHIFWRQSTPFGVCLTPSAGV